MHGGGVKGLIGDEEDDEGKMEEMDPEEVKMIEEQFRDIYTSDPKLREMIGGDPTTLNVKEKFQILMAYKKGGIQGLMGEGEEEEDESVIVHQGKKFRRVQIEGENQDYLMDDDGNIYDTEFQFIGQANPSDDEDM